MLVVRVWCSVGVYTMFSRVAISSKTALRRNLGTYKTSTGLVGLAVDPNGRENLISVADKILDSITVGG